MEEEHAPTLTPMQTCRHATLCQEAHRVSGTLHVFRPPHACENACGRQCLGFSSCGLMDSGDLQAPGDRGAPGGPQNPFPPGGQPSLLPTPCPGTGAQVRWRCLHMKQQRVCDFQGPCLCPAYPTFPRRCHHCKATCRLEGRLKHTELCDLCFPWMLSSAVHLTYFLPSKAGV